MLLIGINKTIRKAEKVIVYSALKLHIFEMSKIIFSTYSRSALSLDVVAITALIIYITRVVLGYKQTRDRYQVSQPCQRFKV